MRQTEPGKVFLDRGGEFGRRAFVIGVVHAEHEPAAVPPCKEEVEKRGAGIADMEAARGRRGEADGDVRGG